MNPDEIWMLIVASGLVILPAFVIPMVLYYRQERWKIALEHERRLRALELGRALPGDRPGESWFSPLRVGLIIAAGVPMGAFLSAMTTSLAVGFHDGIWIATSTVSLGAVISGSIIAGRAYTEPSGFSAEREAKPFVDEDAYDVVAARG